jgi:gluconate 2-dehydrogenase alpha chain
MAQRLKLVDVVTVGVGLTGSLTALELVKTGLKVVGIERGAGRDTVPDFQSPAIHDELRFSIRKGMMQDNVEEAMTFQVADFIYKTHIGLRYGEKSFSTPVGRN